MVGGQFLNSGIPCDNITRGTCQYSGDIAVNPAAENEITAFKIMYLGILVQHSDHAAFLHLRC